MLRLTFFFLQSGYSAAKLPLADGWNRSNTRFPEMSSPSLRDASLTSIERSLCSKGSSGSDQAGGRLDYECLVYVDSSRPVSANSSHSRTAWRKDQIGPTPQIDLWLWACAGSISINKQAATEKAADGGFFVVVCMTLEG